MTEDQRKALAELHLDSTLTQEDVWNSTQAHVAGLHVDAQHMISKRLKDARDSSGPSPTGVVINGRSGSGKTHLLGWVRRQQRQAGGYFFLSNLGDSEDFWANIAKALLDGLTQDGEDDRSQLEDFLRKVSSAAGIPPADIEALTGAAALTPERLDEFAVALRQLNRQVGAECQDAARALVLLASPDPRQNNVAYDYLTSSGEMTPGNRTRWGFRARPHEARRVVADVSKLLALTGPSVIAIDQIDTLVASSTKATVSSRSSDDAGVDARIARVADGLMLLREETRRTLTVVACLPSTWELFKAKSVKSVPDRFVETPHLSRIPEVRIGRELVEARLAQTFARIGFTPPYPSWPVAPSAFDEVKEFTPRILLNRVDRHVEACLRGGEVRELTTFAEDVEELPPLSGGVSGVLSLPSHDDLDRFDARFDELVAAADVAAPLDPSEEDRAMPSLLVAGLTAWIAERGSGELWAVDPLSAGKSALLHARLRRTLDEETEEEAHWSFRAIAHADGRTAGSKLRKAGAASGMGLGVPGRALVLIRNTQWSPGRVTQEYLRTAEQTGGGSVPVTEDDLRTFSALRQMIEEHEPGLYDWLDDRRPAGATELFSAVLPAAGIAEQAPEVLDAEPESEPQRDEAPMVPVGELAADRRGVRVRLASLRKHVVVFAGSGSGKTVLLRRLIEECALLGVSSIVLDVNNDLARLGDSWPSSPDGWYAGDESKATKYLDDTDVVIWTPGRAGGRPLGFPPLPDFAAVLDDQDEFDFAVKAASASLASSAGVNGNSVKAKRGRAVLTETLRYFGKSGGRNLEAFINVLADLPDQVSDLAGAAGFAAEVAESLRAARVNDPFLREVTEPGDPGTLLTPAEGKAARVSIISLDGLPSLPERQSFVNRLQLELFAWVKRHPAGDRPLGGLLVMDEAQDFAPATGTTPSTESSIRLASQARKYGLGLVFATQAPKALHNRVSGNATTQFFGRQNHPTHIEAARNLARAKGRDLPDLGRLTSGQFYVTGDDIGFQKVHTPLCLSHHPASPLTTDEVVDRARRR